MSPPMTREQIINRYFLEMRCKVLEVAASLDRMDRAESSSNGHSDPRIEKLGRAIEVLLDAGPDRAERIQMIFSREYDPAWQNKG